MAAHAGSDGVEPGGAHGRPGHGSGAGMWRTEEAFRSADGRRCLPVEIEFGARWFGAEDDAPWQVRWLGATGELVAISLDGPVRLLAVGVTRIDVEETLRGWWQVCGHRGSLPWVERRARAIPTQPLAEAPIAGDDKPIA